jgi:hypothetical protein
MKEEKGRNKNKSIGKKRRGNEEIKRKREKKEI